MPRVTVCLLTYNRFEYAEKTLKSFLENTTYTLGELCVHIADDGSDNDYVDRLRYLAGCYSSVASVSSSITERRGYGGNYNRATQVIHEVSDFVFPLEDDWELTKLLDLDVFVKDLIDSNMNAIRLGYVGWTQELLAKFVGINGRAYLNLLGDSQELHVFSGHPRLETVEYERKVGLWPEFCSPGDAEIAVSFRAAARTGILWPLWTNSNNGLFRHFGDEKSEWA